jgi:hypothetical protein
MLLLPLPLLLRRLCLPWTALPCRLLHGHMEHTFRVLAKKA